MLLEDDARLIDVPHIGDRDLRNSGPTVLLGLDQPLCLEALKGLAPMQKALLVKGLFAAVTADGTIRVMEAELMRLVGAVLDCPLPPLLESVDPATLAE